jgi:UDP-N-acetylmuramate--alanine ligase
MAHSAHLLNAAQPSHAHLVGIGGAGMGALADVLLDQGWSLSGSDLAQPSPYLVSRGVRCYAGHAEDQLPPHADVVIYSSAIPPENVELSQAAQCGIPAVSYAEMLGHLMQGKRGLAVAGTHGKSTTVAMAAHILFAAARDPTVVAGGTPLGAHSGGRAGAGDLVLVEACEYKANFLHLRPHDAAILGIEPDHFDCYDTRESLECAFAQFADLLPPDGTLTVPYACHVSRRIAAARKGPSETFGLDVQADWSAKNVICERGYYGFDLLQRGRALGRVRLQVAGMHNVQNALAAASLAGGCGVSAAEIVAGLSDFRGLHRRLEVHGNWGGVLFLDDYAHHPTEVSAALAAVRAMAPGRRIWCVFQPHQASRTARLLDELASSLQNADKVLVAEIFRAREGPARPGEVAAEDLARQVRAGGTKVPGHHRLDDIERFLTIQLTAGDVLVTMGAGDIGRIGYGLMDRFGKDRAVG